MRVSISTAAAPRCVALHLGGPKASSGAALDGLSWRWEEKMVACAEWISDVDSGPTDWVVRAQDRDLWKRDTPVFGNFDLQPLFEARGPFLLSVCLCVCLSVCLSSVCLLAFCPPCPWLTFWAAWTLACEVLNTVLALAFPSRARFWKIMIHLKQDK